MVSSTRFNALDLDRLQRVQILVEERVAEDAHCGRVGVQALHDQVVVLACLHKHSVEPHPPAILLHPVAVLVHGELQCLAAGMHDQFDKRIPGSGGRRWAVGKDLVVGKI